MPRDITAEKPKLLIVDAAFQKIMPAWQKVLVTLADFLVLLDEKPAALSGGKGRG